MANIKITETILRDAHQSLIAARMSLDDMLPMLGPLDEVGFHSVEMWGGATFDACIRSLDEDPWERLRIIKKHMPKTKMQTLFRGQNMLGRRHYADDVVEYFVKKMVDNGIDIIRVFDALNDIRNLETSVGATKKAGAHVQAALSYTISPAHSVEYFVNYAKDLEGAGADSVCIKDTAGLITPYAAYELVRALKEALGVPVQLHTHYTSGFASMSCLKAAEAGVDIIDTAMSPLALGTSLAATESMVAAFADTPYDTGLNLKKLGAVREYAVGLRDKYLENNLLSPKIMGVDANTLLYQVPGGMLANLMSQLAEAGKPGRPEAVLNEILTVRKDSGYPPLVAPASQIVGSQAVSNLITGERYKMVTNEFKSLVRGEYGKTPAPIDPEFRKRIIGDEEPVDCRPADLLAGELETLRSQIPEKYNEQEEDILTLAQFPQAAPGFFESRLRRLYGVDAYADITAKVYPV